MEPLMNNVHHITNLYRAVVADSGVEKIAFQQAVHEVAAQVQPLIDSGELVPDTYSWVKALVTQVDKAEKGSTDETIAAICRGEDDLSLDAPDYLDRVVTLGGGGRKSWRFVTAGDLDEMDELRHRNVRSVNRSYHKDWKPKYLALGAVLRRNLTLGAAVQAGDLPTLGETLFESA